MNTTLKLPLQPSITRLNRFFAGAVDAEKLNTTANISPSSDILTDSQSSDSETALRLSVAAHKPQTQRLNSSSCKQSRILAVIMM